mmetsp:Transcript_35697/g.96874  ORF Transcript_35697/g.96874 Transcript_35697/m.96874 type:complete len:320 (-) Transcript_35697:857-1816(-)
MAPVPLPGLQVLASTSGTVGWVSDALTVDGRSSSSCLARAGAVVALTSAAFSEGHPGQSSPSSSPCLARLAACTSAALKPDAPSPSPPCVGWAGPLKPKGLSSSGDRYIPEGSCDAFHADRRGPAMPAPLASQALASLVNPASAALLADNLPLHIGPPSIAATCGSGFGHGCRGRPWKVGRRPGGSLARRATSEGGSTWLTNTAGGNWESDLFMLFLRMPAEPMLLRQLGFLRALSFLTCTSCQTSLNGLVYRTTSLLKQASRPSPTSWGVLLASGPSRSRRRRFISICITLLSKSFASFPKGFSISTAIKFKAQRMKI